MTAIDNTVPAATTTVAGARSAHAPVWRVGLVASVAAAIATTVVAAGARAAGIAIEAEPGAAIPLLGFAQLTFVFSLVGVALAAVLTRRARRPRSTFVRTTVALTVLSCVPDVLLPTTVADQATLVVTHLVAAAVVIPALASRLPVVSSRRSA